MNHPTQSFDIIIIGGAASGATMALRMARAGWRTAVVEKAVFPRRKVCGEFMSPTNQPLFDDLGIGGEVKSIAGSPVDSVALFHGEDVVTSPMPDISGGERVRGFALGRDVLDDLLLKKAEAHGAMVIQPAKVCAIKRSAGSVTVSAEDHEIGVRHLTAPVVVAAHGSWGASDLPTFPKSAKPSPKDLFGLKAHFTGAQLPGGLMPLFVFPGGYGGLVATDCGRVSFSCCVRREELATIRQGDGNTPLAPGEAVVAHLKNSIRGIREVLAGAEADGTILSTGPIRPGIRKAYHDGIFKVGNACGEAHPIIAEGISMAMQSSWILSEEWVRAGRGGDPDAVAENYQTRWNRAFKGRIRASFFFAGMAMNPGVAGTLKHLFKAFPRLLTYGAEMSGKAKVVVRSEAATALA